LLSAERAVAAAPVRELFAARERLEQAAALVGPDPGAVVLDADDELAVGALEPHRDAAALPPVGRRVVERVVYYQPQTALPAVDRALVDAPGQLVDHARVAL